MSFARDVSAMGAAFAHVINAATGPNERLRIATERFSRGEIDIEELERRVALIVADEWAES